MICNCAGSRPSGQSGSSRKVSDSKLSGEKSQAGKADPDDAEKGTSKGVTGNNDDFKPTKSGSSTGQAGKGPAM